MKISYLLLLCGAVLGMNYLGIRIQKEKSPLVKTLVHLFIAVTVTVFSSMFAMIVPVKEAALFLQCIHYISTEWLLIFLLRFMEEYTDRLNSTGFSRGIIYFLTICSNISILLNGVFHHVVTCEYENIGKGEMCNVFTTMSPWYNVHLYFTYVLAIFNLGTLLVQAFRIAQFYRKKYTIALFMLLCTLALDAICNMMEFPLDYSLYIYIALAIFLGYYSIYYIPQELIRRTLSYVVEDSRSGVICFDVDGKCIFANEEAMGIYGNPKEISELESVLLEEVGSRYFSEGQERTWNKVFLLKDREMHYEVSFNKLFDKKGGYIGCYFILYDKTEDAERLASERYRATHDSLTGLYNRDYFYEQVQSALKDNPDKDYFMVCVDIKDFKLINDLFGFEKGNEILIQLARTIRDFLPEGTACGRMESDHFAFCISKDSYREEKILSGIGKLDEMFEKEEYQIYIHVGVYGIQKEDYDVSVMCDRANMAITMVKNNYECMIAHYDKGMMERVMREKQLVAEFESALEEKQFVMFLQPQVATDGTVLGAEALVRWIHPERGMVPPGEFIEVFENAGLIHHLDQYIWELAAQKLQEWKRNGYDNLHISVNISTKDFYYLDIYKVFTDLVEKYDISPEKLKLEITETALMMELDKQLELIGRLQDFGFHVEIDDFGSGYSSLNMLKDIQADVLKIDMGFLRETENHERTRIILGMVVDLAKRLKMTVITEGVESKDQVDYLTEVGCDMFQGYYFDRPIAVSDFEARYV